MIKDEYDTDFSRILTSALGYLQKIEAPTCYRLMNRGHLKPLASLLPTLEANLRSTMSTVFNGLYEGLNDRIPKLDLKGYSQALRTAAKLTSIRFGSSPGLWLEIQGPFIATSILTTPVLTTLQETLISSALNQGHRSRLANHVIEAVRNLDCVDPQREIKFSDLGTRRRVSYEYQLQLLEHINQIAPERLLGTGNASIANQVKIPALGMMHHDFVLAMTIDGTCPDDERRAHQRWLDTFPVNSTLLTDTFGLKNFLLAYNAPLMKQTTSLRHDSGDPVEWASAIYNHIREYGIHPQECNLVFSDSLKWEQLGSLHQRIKPFGNPTYGIGTAFTGISFGQPKELTIKLVEFDGRKVAKQSDDMLKNSVDDEISRTKGTIVTL